MKQQRVDEIMSLQEGIAAEINQQKIGRTLNVMIDRQEGDFFIGRTEYDSPEVDGEVLVPIGENASLQIGSIYPILITGAETFDLYGKVK